MYFEIFKVTFFRKNIQLLYLLIDFQQEKHTDCIKFKRIYFCWRYLIEKSWGKIHWKSLQAIFPTIKWSRSNTLNKTSESSIFNVFSSCLYVANLFSNIMILFRVEVFQVLVKQTYFSSSKMKAFNPLIL